jgi:hypothetical protein
MRLIGFLLLVAVIIVGWRVFTFPPTSYVTNPPAPVAQVPVQLAPQRQFAAPVSTDNLSVPEPQEPVAFNCDATAHDYNASSPTILSVPQGHRLVVSFFSPGQQEQVTVLGSGEWKNPGWLVGSTYLYNGCPQDRVSEQAAAHASRRSGDYLGVGAGFNQ